MHQIKPWIKGVSSIAVVIMLLFVSGNFCAAAVPITATDADSLQVDVNGNTKVNKGDTIRHTITIQGGSSDSTGTNFSETIDANTTLVPGSLKTTSVAQNHSYSAVGNVRIQVPAGSGLLLNSFGIPMPTAVAATGTSTNSGNYSVSADGSFTYNPPPGFEGTDTFTYTATNGNAPDQTGTVSIVVSGMIWFVNNNAGACSSSCDGRLTNPFTTLAALNTINDGVGTHPATNDNIFLYESSTSYIGPITLLNGQKLFGQDSTSDLQTLTGLTPPSFSDSLPVMNSGNATFVTITSATGSDIVLANGNTLRGFILGNAASAALSGSNFGTLTLSEVAVNTNGAGLSLNTGTANATFSSFTSSGGINNILFSAVGGTTNLGSGNLAGASGTAVSVTGGNGTLSYTGTVTKTSSGRIVDIQSRTGGSVTFSGNLTCNTSCTGMNASSNVGGTLTFSGASKVFSTATSTAVTLNANTGATINFTGGGLSTTTTSGNGLSATGGGTVTVQGTGNTITSTTGTALNVQNTTIGAGGLTFQSISANGGANGIVLVNTGSSGGLTVTGDGINTAQGGNSSGGTIQNMVGADGATSGSGIYMDNTSNVILRRMTIGGANQNFGIRGFRVNNFALEYSTVSGTNGTHATFDNYGEGSVMFGDDASTTTNGLTGAATVKKCNISGGRARNFSVVNTAGTLNRLTITGTAFGLNQIFVDANQSLAIEARNSGTVVNITVDGSTADGQNAFTGAPSDLANFTGQTGTTMDVIFKNNALSNSHAWNVIGGGGMTLATQGSMTFDVNNNTMRDADGSAVTLFKANDGTLLSGRFTNNIIGNSGVIDSGSKSGNGIFVSAAGTGTMAFTIANNQIHQINGNSHIYADNTGGSYAANFTITGNTFDTPGVGWFAGIAMTNGAPSNPPDPEDTVNVCAMISGNAFNFPAPPAAIGANYGAFVYVAGAAAGHTFNLPGYAGGADTTNVQDFIQGNNAGTFITWAEVQPNATASQFTGNGTSCPTP